MDEQILTEEIQQVDLTPIIERLDTVIDNLFVLIEQINYLGFYIIGVAVVVVGAISAKLIFDFLRSRGPV